MPYYLMLYFMPYYMLILMGFYWTHNQFCIASGQRTCSGREDQVEAGAMGRRGRLQQLYGSRFPQMGVSKNRLFIVYKGKLTKINDLGVPLFQELPYTMMCIVYSRTFTFEKDI